MKRAHVRDAVHTEKFFFRKEVFRHRRRHGNASPAGAWGTRSREASTAGADFAAAAAAAGASASGSRAESKDRSDIRRSVLMSGHSMAEGANGGGGGTATPRSARSSRAASPELPPVETEYDEFTMDELINGNVS